MYKFWIYELIISKLMIQNISLLKYYSRSKYKDMVCFILMWLRNEPSHLVGLFEFEDIRTFVYIFAAQTSAGQADPKFKFDSQMAGFHFLITYKNGPYL